MPRTTRVAGGDGDEVDAEALIVGDLVVHAGVNPSVHAGPVA